MPEEFTQYDGYQVHTLWNDIIFGGSALVGRTDATYEQLVAKFGEPMDVNGAHIDKRWLVRADDGTAFTVFNYQGETTYSIGGFGKVNKYKENISLLKAKEIIGNGI